MFLFVAGSTGYRAVDRKPTEALEGELQGTLNLDRGVDYAGYSAYGRVGTAHEHGMPKLHSRVSFRIIGTLLAVLCPPQRRRAASGERGLSRTEDRRLNLKAGFSARSRF